MPTTNWETDLQAGVYTVTIIEQERVVGETLYQFAGWQDNLGNIDPNTSHIFTHPISDGMSILTALFTISIPSKASLTIIGSEDSVSLVGIGYTIIKL